MSKGITQPDAVETRYFAGFPGVYGPGVVVPLEATGLSEQEAAQRIRAEKLPLKIVDLDPKPRSEPKTKKDGE